MLTLTQEHLPTDASQLAHPIDTLFVEGENFTHLLSSPRLAIVGSRKITPYGRGTTENLSASLAARGVVIVSGLALGVDSVAHQACIANGGRTIAVLPSGLDKIYPSSNTQLAHRIVKQDGALVTEYRPGTIPYPGNFLERNRIIAALSDGVLVTEAAMRSGSLNTANHALQLGKPVLAVPGNITSPLSAGCNNLIKAGATPITSVEDIMNAMQWHDTSVLSKKVIGTTDHENRIILLLESGISDGALLLLRSGLTASEFNETMTMLEITARIRPIGANHWSL